MGDDVKEVREDGLACREAVRRAALALGFDDCRIASVAGPAGHAELFSEWLADGAHGTMEWMERGPERRMDPREVLPGCRSVVVLALTTVVPALVHTGKLTQDSTEN